MWRGAGGEGWHAAEIRRVGQKETVKGRQGLEGSGALNGTKGSTK